MPKTIAIVVLVLLPSGSSPRAEMTDIERQRLLAHMEMTSRWLLDEVSGLSADQLRFRRAPGTWSIAEVVDHLVVVAPIYWQDLQTAVKEPAGDGASLMTDAAVLWYGIDRTSREQAIQSELPSGQLRDVRAALDEYRRHHDRLRQYISTTRDDLRRHIVRRQRCDAYQWALLISTHEQRHVLQIRAIKADPDFPKPQAAVRWNAVLDQPPAWYGSPEARAIADAVLAWQLDSFGWPKNIDMTRPPQPGEKPGPNEATIDNGATTTQLRLLARVYEATNDGRYREGFWRGLLYLLDAQYSNGGWPQYFPLRTGYHTRITYNDDAVTNVMMLLWDVADAMQPYTFLRPDARERARRAVEKGVDVILRTQIRVNGRLIAWCQQHDEVTLEPRPGRTFEPVALVSAESVGIVRVLMRVERPDARVIEAVEAAVAWLRDVRIGGRDRWARFYEIGTNRPIFAGRDAVVRYRLEEIEQERRDGYSWYGEYAAALLGREYPAWKARIGPARPQPCAAGTCGE